MMMMEIGEERERTEDRQQHPTTAAHAHKQIDVYLSQILSAARHLISPVETLLR
ncbi:unnamed protein product [Ectocarpus sp. 8 AP-2014]